MKDIPGLTYWSRKGADGWQAYWDSLNAPHRDALVKAVRMVLPPDGSLLEIGCGPGVNLWRILQACPDVDVTGLDVNQAAIDAGAARVAAATESGELPGRGRAAFCCGELPVALDAMEPVDVVLSCYTLAYVEPPDIQPTMEALTDLARRAVVLAEPMRAIGAPSGPIPNTSSTPRPREYRYDYLRWFTERASGWRVTMMAPLHVDRMNRLLVAERVNA